MPRHPTIREQLEQDAQLNDWSNYPRFARCRAALPARRRRTAAVNWPRHRQIRALLLLAYVLILLLIVRVESVRAEPSSGFWGIEATAAGGALHSLALNTDIEVEVSGLAARVAVAQRFRNDGEGWKEAVYRFPLPDGAAVDRLRIEAGGRVLEGEIREQDDARRQYQQARHSGHLATLVEQQRPNQFETRLANIGPGEEIRVEIGFLVQVDYADGAFSLRLPMTFTPRWAGPNRYVGPNFVRESDVASVPNDVRSYDAPQPELTAASNDHFLTLDIELHSGIALASLESRYHDVDIQPVPSGYRVRLADPQTADPQADPKTDLATRSDRLFELSWTPGYGRAPEASLMTWDGVDAVYALLMLAPPLPDAVAPQPREVVFVIDTSGSMEGVSLQQARAALREGLGFLAPGDRFNIVRFDSETELLFDESMPAVPFYLEGAAKFIDRLVADGGTDMAPALDQALGLPRHDGLLRQVVFVTDGAVGNEQELLLQVAERLGESRLFTVSIGPAPNSGFMRKAAAIGRGSHSHIGRQEEVGERMAQLWARIKNPALQNLCVDWGMEAEFYPEIIPDLYEGEPLWLYARLPFAPQEVMVCGELEGRYWETTSALNPTAGGEALATLWARSKIEALEDSRIFGIDPASVRRQVVEIALRFGLLTRYTSLVAVDHTPSRPGAESLEAEHVPGLLPAGSATAVSFARTATGWPAQLALSLLSLAIAAGMLLFATPARSARRVQLQANPGYVPPPVASPSP
jgi:Ca-activated chloride channel family protein